MFSYVQTSMNQMQQCHYKQMDMNNDKIMQFQMIGFCYYRINFEIKSHKFRVEDSERFVNAHHLVSNPLLKKHLCNTRQSFITRKSKQFV